MAIAVTNTATGGSQTQWTTTSYAITGVSTTGANQLLVGMFAEVHNNLTTPSLIASVTDNSGLGLTWTKAVENHNLNGAGNPNAEIWWAACPSQITGVTVTVTYAEAMWESRGAVISVSGAKNSAPIGATGVGCGANNPSGANQNSAVVPVGPIQGAGSLVVAALGKYDDGGAYAFAAGTQLIYNTVIGWSSLVRGAALTVAGDVGNNISLGYTTIPPFGRYVGAEILVAPPVTGGPPSRFYINDRTSSGVPWPYHKKLHRGRR